MATKIEFADRVKTAKGAEAISPLAGWIAKEGKAQEGLIKALIPALTFYTKDDAKHVYETAHAAAAKLNKKPLTEAPAPRVSAAAGLWKAQDYKSWPTFRGHLEKLDPAWDTLINLCNWYRGKDENKKARFPKDSAIGPTYEQVEAFLNAKKEARKERDKAAKLEGIDAVKVAPGAALLATIETLTHLVTIETDKTAKAYLAAATKALDSYKPFVAKLEEEAAVEAAKKAVREKFAGK